MMNQRKKKASAPCHSRHDIQKVCRTTDETSDEVVGNKLALSFA